MKEAAAIKEYYNGKPQAAKFARILKAVKSGNTKGLSDEEQGDVWRIRSNIKNK